MNTNSELDNIKQAIQKIAYAVEWGMFTGLSDEIDGILHIPIDRDMSQNDDLTPTAQLV